MLFLGNIIFKIILKYADKNIQEIAFNNQDEILEELNIKYLKLVEKESDLVQYSVKLNYQMLGRKYGNEINQINQRISEMGDIELVNLIKNDITI